MTGNAIMRKLPQITADSPLTIQSIMDSVAPTADPGGVSTALRWVAPGSYSGSDGVYELVVDPATNKVLHFLYTSTK